MKTRWPLWQQNFVTNIWPTIKFYTKKDKEREKKKVESGKGKCYNFSLKLTTKVKAWKGEQAKMGKYFGILEHISTSVGKWVPTFPNIFWLLWDLKSPSVSKSWNKSVDNT
jgi:hypothetical protein